MSTGHTQNQNKIDSLKKVLSSEKSFSRINPLIKIGTELSDNDVPQALTYLDEAYNLALATGDSANVVKSGWITGELWKRQELYENAVERLNYVLPIAARNNFRKDHKRILNTLAVIYTYQSKYDVALKLNFQSLVLREQDDDKAGMGIAYNNIGLNYFKLNNIELALQFYNKALEIKEAIHDQYDLDLLLVNIGLCHNKLSDYRKAKAYIEKGMSYCQSNCGASLVIGAEFGIGVSYFGLREWENAKLHFEKSLRLAIENADKRYQIENLSYLAKVYYGLKDFVKSKEYLEKSLTVVKSTSYKDPLLDIYKQYSLLANQSQDYKIASFYQQKYIELRDSIYSEEVIKNLATIQTNFVEKENLATIASNRIMIQQQRSINALIGTSLVLLFAVAYMFYRERQNVKKVNANLSDRVDEYTQEIFEANEKLRKALEDHNYFMYKTSHDLRGPLTTFLGLCNIAKLDVKDPLGLDYFERIEKTALRLNSVLTRLLTIEKMHQHDIEYNFINFQELLEDIIKLEKKNETAERISFSYEIDPLLIAKSDKTIIQIILDNLISNAVKYSNDSLRVDPFVKIQIVKDNSNVVIRIIDNGIGIAENLVPNIFNIFVRASERSQSGGVGLYITKMAVEKLEGKIFIRPMEVAGTHFEVVLPLDIGPILRKQKELEVKLEERRKNKQKEKGNLGVLLTY